MLDVKCKESQELFLLTIRCSDQVLAVLLKTFFFKWPSLVKYWGNMLLYWVRGIVLISAPGSTFTGRGLQSCFMTIWRVVWNDVWPSGAQSVYSWPSLQVVLGSNDIIWLTWCLWGVRVHLLLCSDLLLWWLLWRAVTGMPWWAPAGLSTSAWWPALWSA